MAAKNAVVILHRGMCLLQIRLTDEECAGSQWYDQGPSFAQYAARGLSRWTKVDERVYN